MRTPLIASVTAVLLALISTAGSAADEPSAESPDRKESLAILTEIASSFDVRLDEDRLAVRTADPAVRWNNTIGHATDAALFFWMHGGRPVAVGTTFVNDNAIIGHEFQSLAPGPIDARRRGKTVWAPQEPGIEFRPLDEAPQPARTARARLSQVKALAHRFRAEAVKSPPAYQEDDVRELRLLPQPILQYHEDGAQENEGAVFTFAMDTDVDVLLLIESRSHAGKARWEYALARTNPYVLKVWCDKALVWSKPRILSISDPERPYFLAGPFPFKPAAR